QICPHSDGRKTHFSGTKIRQMFSENNSPSNFLMRPEVYDHIINMRKEEELSYAENHKIAEFQKEAIFT
ncbi:ATP-sulfurylase domain protein, partial [mine drainage metagenome]